MALVGKAKPDVPHIEKVSDGGGTIVTARVVAKDGAVSARGSVRKTTAGWVTTAYSHIDVIVLDGDRNVVDGIATNYFPPACNAHCGLCLPVEFTHDVQEDWFGTVSTTLSVHAWLTPGDRRIIFTKRLRDSACKGVYTCRA
jgi:hypothetical protein